ncbi:MAG TPA: hypothetical protein VMM56_04605 [Planctomycetaceae bacterium]|nr:hypothetical protein [Planctomycetaceae bacterium]
MFPRFYCVFCVFISCFSSALLHADEAQQKPDPGRFRTPVVRAWFPSTFAADQQAFLNQIQREMNEENSDSPPDPNTVTESQENEFAKREGLLVYYDPHKPAWLTYDEISKRFIDLSIQNFFPGGPWLKPVRFLRVGTRDEFEKEVRRRTGVDDYIPLGTLAAKGDGFFFNNTTGGIWLDPPTGILDPYLQQVSRFWTYRDGYMFFGDFEEILTMGFPDVRQLELNGTDAERDVFVRVDLNAILPKQKRLLWEIIRKQAERSLQQSDAEGEAEYALRKSIGDLQLTLIQAVTQDLESLRIGIDFASEEQPARADLELIARPGVNLTQTFGSSGRGIRELAALIDEPAAMTFATSWGLPESMADPFEKFFRLFNVKLAEQQSWNVDALLASEELTLDLLESVRESNHVVLKLDQTEHGFTLFGGLRLFAADRISKNLEVILNGLTNANGWGVQRSRDKSGRTYFSFRPSELSDTLAANHRERFPAELHFTVIDSILWFSVGREDSLEILSNSLDRIEDNQNRPANSTVPLALFEITLDRLFPGQGLEETQGFDRIPLAAVEKLDSMIPRKSNSHSTRWVNNSDHIKLGAATTGRRFLTLHKSPIVEQPREIVKPSIITSDEAVASDHLVINFDYSQPADFSDVITFSIGQSPSDPLKLKKFLQPDRSRIRLQFDADEKRVRVRATVVLGVIKHVVSRMMQSETANFTSKIIYLNDGNAEKFGAEKFGVDLKVYNSAENDNP